MMMLRTTLKNGEPGKLNAAYQRLPLREEYG